MEKNCVESKEFVLAIWYTNDIPNDVINDLENGTIHVQTCKKGYSKHWNLHYGQN